jgi:hypothetical protein
MVLYGRSEKLSFRKENPFLTCSTNLQGQTCRYAFDHGAKPDDRITADSPPRFTCAGAVSPGSYSDGPERSA